MTLQQKFNQVRELKLVRFPDDCERIEQVARREDLFLTFLECEKIWEWWSNRVDAQWLTIWDDAEIIDAINSYINNKHEAIKHLLNL